MATHTFIKGKQMLQAPNSDIKITERSPLALAFVGDGVLELLVRSQLVATSRKPSGALHREAVNIVSAKNQFLALTALQEHLTPKEQDIVRRGRNASKATVAKHASAEEYRASTGLEALFGWLYLQNNLERVQQLFDIIWQWHLSRNI